MQSVSIIVTCQEQQTQLRGLLPQLLSQRYGGEYEVIVVDKMHDKDMAEWLEEMEVQYPHLSHTFCPASARGIDTQRLALTLGAKAANYEWLVILPVDTDLPGDDWLSHIATCCDEQADIIINSKGLNSRFKMTFFRLRLRLCFAKYFRVSNLFRLRLTEGKNFPITFCRRSILFQATSRIPKKRLSIRPLEPQL